MKAFGVPPPPDVITHCRRELYHAVIKLILEGKFAEAYKHGIVIEFPDGIHRRVFPRFYCYSADYPEKSASLSFILTTMAEHFSQNPDRKYQEHGEVPMSTLLYKAHRGVRSGEGRGYRKASKYAQAYPQVFPSGDEGPEVRLQGFQGLWPSCGGQAGWLVPGPNSCECVPEMTALLGC